MNVNDKIMTIQELTGIEVQQNLYNGDAEEWIVFNYADERSNSFADDAPTSDTVYLMIHLYTKRDFLDLKEAIKTYLEKEGFDDISIQSYYEDGWNNVVFECEYTQGRS